MKTSRLGQLFQSYGPVAVGVYLVIFVLVLASFAVAIQQGVDVQSAAGHAGLWGSAWLATKLTQPLRLLATAVLTPLVASALRRLGWWSPKNPPQQATPAADSQ